MLVLVHGFLQSSKLLAHFTENLMQKWSGFLEKLVNVEKGLQRLRFKKLCLCLCKCVCVRYHKRTQNSCKFSASSKDSL